MSSKQSKARSSKHYRRSNKICDSEVAHLLMYTPLGIKAAKEGFDSFCKRHSQDIEWSEYTDHLLKMALNNARFKNGGRVIFPPMDDEGEAGGFIMQYAGDYSGYVRNIICSSTKELYLPNCPCYRCLSHTGQDT